MVSLLDSTDRLARILGPGAISLLVVIVPEIRLFSLDAASFVVSAFCLGRVLRHARPPRPRRTVRLSHDPLSWPRAGR
jgi:hypothetical protein